MSIAQYLAMIRDTEMKKIVSNSHLLRGPTCSSVTPSMNLFFICAVSFIPKVVGECLHSSLRAQSQEFPGCSLLRNGRHDRGLHTRPRWK